MCTSFGCASCSRARGPPISVSFAFVLRSDVPLAPRLLTLQFLFRSNLYVVRMCLFLPCSWPSHFCFVRICIPFGCASCSLALGILVSDPFACVLRSDVPLVPGLVALPFLFRSHSYFVRMCLCLRARSYFGTVIGHMCSDSFIKISGFSLALWLGMWSMAQFS